MYAIRYKELVKKDEGINNNMAKKRDKKNKLRGKWLRGIIIVYLLLILCNLFHEFPSRLGNLHSIPVSEEWYLIVVNRWNEIPEDYRVELTELSNGQKVDSRIYPYLQEMFDAARKDGIYPVVREGYRTYDEQQKILDDKIKAYINEGYSQSRAERTAKEWVALPGTSEHQLALQLILMLINQRAQMMRYIRGLPQMHIIMVSYYGTHKENRRLQGQAMSHGIIDM